MSQTYPWRRSSLCEAGHCVEVAHDGDRVLVRDAAGAVVALDREAWAGFVDDVKRGEFG